MADPTEVVKAPAKAKWVVAGYVVAAAGIALGYGWDTQSDDVVLKVKDGFSIFAVFYVFAQSLERLLEPVSRQWEIKDVEKEEEKATNAGTKLKIAEVAAASAMVSAPAAAPEAITQAEAAAGEKVAANRAKAVINANKEVFLWGMASGGFRFMDLALTALVIGSGTKPLHDLIDRVQKPKPATT